MWPNGAKLAVYLGFNLEHFAFGEGLGAGIGPVSPQPDVLNYLAYSWLTMNKNVGKAREYLATAAAERPDDAHII